MKLKTRLAFMAIAIMSLGIFACKKDDVKPIEKSPLEILTAQPWQIAEIRFLQQNEMYYYKRGATTGNNINFDIEYYKFNKDKTGERSDNNEVFPFTWDFIDAEKTKIRIEVMEGKPLTIIWENIVYKEKSLKYSEYYNRNGYNSLAVATRVPKP